MNQPIDTRAAEYWASRLQRWSGILLALFLPAHFLVLGLALNGGDALDGFLHWTRHPLVRLGEGALVAVLAFHLAGGLRLMLIEFYGWHPWQKTLIAVAATFAAAAGLVFLLRIF